MILRYIPTFLKDRIVLVLLFAAVISAVLLSAPIKNTSVMEDKIRLTIAIAGFGVILVKNLLLSVDSNIVPIKTVLVEFIVALYSVKFFASILEEMYLNSKESPEIFFAFVLGLFGTWLFWNIATIFKRLLAFIEPEFTRSSVGTAAASYTSMSLKKLTEDDVNIIAIHEAGHALIYAVLPNLASSAFVRIGQRNESNNSLGCVSFFEWTGTLKSKSFWEIQLLCLLAGQQAELLIYEESYNGSASDIRSWMKEAKAYLEAGLGEVYLASPRNQLEVQENFLILQRLKNKQSDLLAHFLRVNKGVLFDLATTLKEKRELSGEDLKPFLSRVIVTEGFPTLKEN